MQPFSFGATDGIPPKWDRVKTHSQPASISNPHTIVSFSAQILQPVKSDETKGPHITIGDALSTWDKQILLHVYSVDPADRRCDRQTNRHNKRTLGFLILNSLKLSSGQSQPHHIILQCKSYNVIILFYTELPLCHIDQLSPSSSIFHLQSERTTSSNYFPFILSHNISSRIYFVKFKK